MLTETSPDLKLVNLRTKPKAHCSVKRQISPCRRPCAHHGSHFHFRQQVVISAQAVPRRLPWGCHPMRRVSTVSRWPQVLPLSAGVMPQKHRHATETCNFLRWLIDWLLWRGNVFFKALLKVNWSENGLIIGIMCKILHW